MGWPFDPPALTLAHDADENAHEPLRDRIDALEAAPGFTGDASEITSGTLADARIPASVARDVDVQTAIDALDATERDTLFINGWDHGVTADGVTDDSAALAQCFTVAADASRLTGRRIEVKLPAGEVMCHEVDWDDQTPIVGSDVGHTRLTYNGAGGPGSCILRNPKNGGATPWGGFRRLTFCGWKSGYGLAESAYKVTGTTGVDWGFQLERVQVFYFTGDAFDFGTGIVNLHVDRLRSDGVRGWTILARQGTITDGARPFSLTRWTLDNFTPTVYRNAVTAAGFDPSSWGKGLLKLDPGSDVMLHLGHGRAEYNLPALADSGRKSLVQLRTAASRYARVTVDNVGVAWRLDDALIGVYAPDGRVSCQLRQSALGALNFEDATDPASNMQANDIPFAMATSNAQQVSGFYLNGTLIESRSTDPGGSTFVNYRKGDLVLRRNPAPGARGAAQIITGPSAGAGRFPTQAVATVATTAGSAVVSTTAVNILRFLMPGTAVVIAGAGAGGAALTTQVVSIDPTAMTATLAAAAQTTVAAASVTLVTPETRDVMDMVTYGTAAPTTGTWGRGEKRWNTSPSAGGFVGWVCVAAGTPGTWKGFGAIET